ncbi:unnamed protein product [Clavelina lepadiformis]|uniref:Symplekin/Pta1 N-terminal domain-containing protein n=1 Tax=Clavelina lepadiformis TaxID=159417 RepID=A0ABP0GE88_CLALP
MKHQFLQRDSSVSHNRRYSRHTSKGKILVSFFRKSVSQSISYNWCFQRCRLPKIFQGQQMMTYMTWIHGLSSQAVHSLTVQSVKFLEKVIITLSDRQRYSEIPRKSELCWFLDELPSNHELLNKGDIKALGEEAMQRLLLFVSSPAISRWGNDT